MKKLNLEEPKINQKDSWWCGKDKIDEFKGVSWQDAYKFWQENKKQSNKIINFKQKTKCQKNLLK